MRTLLSLRVLVVLLSLDALIALPRPAHADFCWIYAGMTGRFVFSEPWDGGFCGTVPDPGGSFDSGDQTTWTILHYHCNWHDINGTNSCAGEATGLQFIAFHRQLILDYDIWRLCGDDTGTCGDGWNNERLEYFDPQEGAIIPGNEEDGTQGYNRGGASDCDDGSDAGTDDGRPQGQTCDGCYALPAELIGGNLAAMASLGDVGVALDCDFGDWHGRFHSDIGALSGECDDIAPVQTPPRDPAFWMAHKKLDEVARDWQRYQAMDLIIVIDRSGSMNDNCPGGTDDPGETPCKINDAREAAKMIVDMIPEGGSHRVGLVSFGSDATTNMLLTAVDGNQVAIEAAIDGILINCGPPGCQTSIGDGLAEAVDVLTTDPSPNEHQAILLLSDGAENEPDLIEDVQGDIPLDIQVCAIGYGTLFEDNEDRLRFLCEERGGILIADDDLKEDGEGGITLEKYFVDCFSNLGDEALVDDPVLTLPAGQVATLPVTVQVCGADGRLTIVFGREWGGTLAPCSLSVIVTTPAGNLVDLNDPLVEKGNGASYNFVRIPLPYRGEQAGVWTARGVRFQRTFTHGFATDTYVTHLQGINLVRDEIHRLFPAGLKRCLYYEDGSPSGRSAYRDALSREVAYGTITLLTTAVSAADFNAKLAQQWDLIVFARQVNRTPQVFDAALQARICEGQKALITDFYNIGNNTILQCAGTIGLTAGLNYILVTGDNRLVSAPISLSNPGYASFFSYPMVTSTIGTPWLVQAFTPAGAGAVIGTGTTCGAQKYFYSTLARGLARVTPLVVRPRVLMGQKLFATFRLSESHRPVGGWDNVTAMVTLDRPGGGALEPYTLYDDGTHGDRLAKNNVWTNEIPAAVTSFGPHVLSAVFTMTDSGGCTVRREAEYSIVVQRDPNTCTGTSNPPPQYAAPGSAVPPPTGVSNLCASRDSFRVTVTDTRGWLCLKTSTGSFIPVPSHTFVTPGTPGARGFFFPEISSLFVCVPTSAAEGESTIVNFGLHSFGHTNQRDTTGVVVVRAHQGVTAIGETLPQFFLHARPNSSSHTVTFDMLLPEEGRATLRIYDPRGRMIATVFDRFLRRGFYGSDGHHDEHSFGHPIGSGAVWDGRDARGHVATAGVYMYQLIVNDLRVGGSVVLLR